MARWKDPITGKRRHRTTGTDNERAAWKFANKLEQQLQAGNIASESKTSWLHFRDRIDNEHLPSLAESTRRKYNSVLDGFEKVIEVKTLNAVQAGQLTRYQSHMRSLGRSEQTIKGNLSYIQAALGWAKSQDMIKSVPEINLPKRAKNSRIMKGRPVTGEEFERMIKVTPVVVGDEFSDSIQYLLRGLWWGGLRLGEALILTWNYGPFCIVRLDDGHYYFRIEHEAEKGNTDRFFPVSPHFEMMLPEEPPKSGLVFRPRFLGMRVIPPRLDSMSKLIKAIGKKAGVVTDVRMKRDKKGHMVEKKIYATAHDLRRGFGTRWAPKVQPKLLMEMMRHATIDTTMKYYVVGDAREASATLWNAVGPIEIENGNKSGNIEPEQHGEPVTEQQETPENKG